MRRLVPAFLLLALAAPRAEAQFFELTPDRDSVHVGDVVTLTARVHLGIQHKLMSPTPVLAGEMPEGIRLLGADTLVKQADGAYEGKVRIAFFRIGRQQTPDLRAAIRLVGGDRPTPVPADRSFVEVTAILPPGEQPLKDIKPLAPVGRFNPLPWVGAALAALVLLLAGWRWRRRRTAPVVAVAEEAAPPPPTALEEALRRLDDIVAAGYLARGEVDAHYAAIAGVLHEYFLTTAAIEPGATTSRILAALARLPDADPLRARTAALLSAADLVKFARVRPSAEQAGTALGAARDVLPAWDVAIAAATAPAAVAVAPDGTQAAEASDVPPR